MLKCECGNQLGATIGNVSVVRHPCQCVQPGDERNPSPRVGLPGWISRRHYEERQRIGAPMVLPAERRMGNG